MVISTLAYFKNGQNAIELMWDDKKTKMLQICVKNVSKAMNK